jgi:putative glutamine amidotransferase
MHEIIIDSSSFLYKITGVKTATVNSLHHQAVDMPADLIRVVAMSADGIVEAIEWTNPEENFFMIAVQWHPERLPFDHPLAGILSKTFVENAKKYHLSEKH